MRANAEAALEGLWSLYDLGRPKDKSDILQAESSWRIWVPEMFPSAVRSGFARHHERAWNWLEALTPGIRPHPLILILARGGGKSTTGETGIVYCGATERRKYVLYVSGTQQQADKHVADIETKLASEKVELYYPQLAERELSKYGSSKGWRRNRLWTAAGFIIDAIGLDTATRGAKAMDQRPDLIVLDDIDGRHDSLDVIQKKIEAITTSILPAGSDDCAVLGLQNLIHRNSIFNQLSEGTADFLLDREVIGPVPALENFKAERRGGKWFIEGTPTWEGQSLETCNHQANTWGIGAFKREAQHLVKEAIKGALFPVYDETYHVISWSEFASVFGKYGALDQRNQPRIPQRGVITRAQDWGATHEHPCMTLWMWRPAEEMPLRECVFIYREMGFPETIYEPNPNNVEVEPVAPTPVGIAIADAERAWNEGGRIAKPVMSHEASAACNTYNKLSKYVSGYPDVKFGKWNAKTKGGIEEIQDYLFIETETVDGEPLLHPFKENLVGRPRMYLVVADDQLQKPVDARGLFRLRHEIPEYRNPTTLGGTEVDKPLAYFNDAIDSLRMLADVHFPRIEPLTEEDRVERLLPQKFKREAMGGYEDMTPKEREGVDIARSTAMAAARQKDKQKRASGGGYKPLRKKFKNRY